MTQHTITHAAQRLQIITILQRMASDYSYVSANDRHRGANDPGSYSAACKHEILTVLSRTGLERYNAEMARIAAEREKQAKDAALQVYFGHARI